GVRMQSPNPGGPSPTKPSQSTALVGRSENGGRQRGIGCDARQEGRGIPRRSGSSDRSSRGSPGIRQSPLPGLSRSPLDPAPVSLTDDNLSVGLKRPGLDAFVAAGTCPGACSPCSPRLPTTVGSRVGLPLARSQSPHSSSRRASSPPPVPTDGSAGS